MMTDPGNPELASAAVAAPELSAEVACQATLALLASLPQRPQRLRVRFADAVIDLDWRLPPAAAAPPAVYGPTAHGLAAQVAAANGHMETLESAVESTTSASGPAPDLHFVRAPSVGTFYCAPKPGAAPFVAEGTVVSVGQQVGIVEAMKLMLPVEADQAGEVVQILVTDGQAVEYDERLLALAPGK